MHVSRPQGRQARIRRSALRAVVDPAERPGARPTSPLDGDGIVIYDFDSCHPNHRDRQTYQGLYPKSRNKCTGFGHNKG